MTLSQNQKISSGSNVGKRWKKSNKDAVFPVFFLNLDWYPMTRCCDPSASCVDLFLSNPCSSSGQSPDGLASSHAIYHNKRCHFMQAYRVKSYHSISHQIIWYNMKTNMKHLSPGKWPQVPQNKAKDLGSRAGFSLAASPAAEASKFVWPWLENDLLMDETDMNLFKQKTWNKR